MPAIRARRGRYSSSYYDGPPPRTPKRPGTPRLATLQLDKIGPAFNPPKITRAGLTKTMLTLVGVCVIAVGGAAALGGGLFDVRAAAANTMDNAVSGIGFRVHDIEITGALGARETEIRALVQPRDGASLFSVDPQELKTRIESLDWVAHVSVHRLWPGTLKIAIERRAAFARWQEDGQVSVIDAAGERLLGERAADNEQLPLIVGEGAGPAAAPLLTALEQLPSTRERTRAIVRVGDRRWDVHVASGAVIALPEQHPDIALAALERLQHDHRLLDRPVSRIDMRLPGRMGVRVRPALLGGPNPDSGAV